MNSNLDGNVSNTMQTLAKNYILDENQNVIAVQIPIAEFEQLEELLENYGLLQLMEDPIDSECLTYHSPHSLSNPVHSYFDRIN